jgi:hypothetical protein
MSFRSQLFLCRCDQVANTSTHCDNDHSIVKQGVQLLQGVTPRVNNGETQA